MIWANFWVCGIFILRLTMVLAIFFFICIHIIFDNGIGRIKCWYGVVTISRLMKLYVSESFAEYRLFYWALLQNWIIFFRSLLVVATPYQDVCWHLSCHAYHHSFVLQSNIVFGTAYCIWSVISPISYLYRGSGSVGLFCHVLLKRGKWDWDWKLRLDDTPNAISCIGRIILCYRVA